MFASGTIKSYEEAPVKVDLNTAVNALFSLDKWLEETIEKNGS